LIEPTFTGTIISENKIMVYWYWWAHWQSVTDESASMPVSVKQIEDRMLWFCHAMLNREGILESLLIIRFSND
jgi:hypothetical protein